MSDQFTTLRDTHAQKRQIVQHTEKQLYLQLQEQDILLQQIQATQQTLGLAALPANHELSKAWVIKQQLIDDLRSQLSRELPLLAQVGKAFHESESMQQRVSRLSDDVPVLLFPLRIQTRFRVTKYIARNCPPSHVLNINALPPQFRLLTLAQMPTIEVGNTTTDFLLSTLSNKSNARELVKMLSPDTAKRWKKQEDLHELLVRIYPDDILLQTHETALTPAEQKSGETFWATMWLSERQQDAAATKAGQQNAWHQLVSTHRTQRSTWIAQKMFPTNYDQASHVEQLQFPSEELKSAAWTRAAETYLLPDAFVVRVYFSDTQFKEFATQPLAAHIQLGLSPTEAPHDDIEQSDGTLLLPDSIRWMTDFDAAERMGMALRITLSPAEMEAGVKKMIVLGVKTAASPSASKVLLEELWQNHTHKPFGLSFVPPGTPTNNLEGHPSGFNPDEQSSLQSFELQFGTPQFDSKTSITTDAQRFAQALGIDASLFQRIANAGMSNASSALLMNQALWPATLGYYLEHFLAPAVDGQDIAYLKQFFQKQVLASGLLPTFRVGKQPYGLLLSSAFSRWQMEQNASPAANRFWDVLKKLDGTWTNFSQSVLKLSNMLNVDQDKWLESFKKLMAQQAHSVEFAHRYIVGEYLLRNVDSAMPDPKLATPINVGQSPLMVNTTPAALKRTMEMANNWGKPLNKVPGLFSKFLADTDIDLFKWNSATRDFVGMDRFPLQTLLNKNIDELWDNPNINNANGIGRLLYFLARQALLRSYVEAAMNKARQDTPKETSPFAHLDFEMEYLIAKDDPNALYTLSAEHLAKLASNANRNNYKTLKNKKAYLDRVVTGKKVSELIRGALKKSSSDFSLGNLPDSINALDQLKNVPHHQLEKLLVGHLDLCNYRLDAWMLGLANERLETMRAKPQGQGIHLAAFAYVENLKPAQKPWVQLQLLEQPSTLTMDRNTPLGSYVLPLLNLPSSDPVTWAKYLAKGIVYMGSDPNFQIKANPDQATGIEYYQISRTGDGHGYVLAPSLAHASTAAVLFSGYAQKGYGTPFSVNINSERTGQAMELLRSIQAGHSLNEQFGYWLERKMYENQLGQHVRAFRKIFPLYSETQEWNANSGNKPKPSNTTLSIDGLAFVTSYSRSRELWRKMINGISLGNKLPVLETLCKQLLDIHDALSDLLLAEGVYQMVQGNPEKAALSLKMGGGGGNITLPEITKITASFQLLGQRMMLVLNDKGNDQAWPTSNSPLSILLPQLNEWLAQQLPKLEKIKLSALVEGASQPVNLPFSALDLQPIDLLLRLKQVQFSKDDTGLIYLAQLALRMEENVASEFKVSIDFERNANFKADEYSLVELLPLLKSIWKLLNQGRPLQPADWFPDPFLAEQPATIDTAPLEQGLNKLLTGAGGNAIKTYLQQLQAQSKVVKELSDEAALASETGLKKIQQLLKTILSGAAFGIWDSRPQIQMDTSLVFKLELLEIAERVEQTLQERLARLQAINLSDIANKRFEDLLQQVQILYGEDLPVFPQYILPNAKDVLASWNDDKLLERAGDFAIEEWLQGIAPVFDNAGYYLGLQVFRESMGASAANNILKIIQVPFVYDQANVWAGGPLPLGYQLPSGTVSLAMETMRPLANNQLVGGFVFEEWREKIPQREHNAGVAIHYQQPDYAEPAQALILAVPAQIKGNWTWDELMQTIQDTMQLARKRAVTPLAYQNTWLNQFLPALIAPVDPNRNTSGIDFGALRSYQPTIERPIGGGGDILINPNP